MVKYHLRVRYGAVGNASPRGAVNLPSFEGLDRRVVKFTHPQKGKPNPGGLPILNVLLFYELSHRLPLINDVDVQHV
jgi:hypothetical protein